MHPLSFTRLHDILDLMCLLAPYHIPDCRRINQNLSYTDSPLTLRAGEQALGDYCQQYGSQLQADLVLLMSGKCIDNPVNCLRCV